VEGERVSDYANEWFSEYLDKSVKLLYAGKLKRPVLSKHGGKDGDIVSFADQAPILLVSTASLTNLNSRLDSPIPMNRFRPNLIVKGSEAFAEDNWKFIKIGECEFEVIQSCERCIFTTIDIETKKKDKYREPLKTLMKYRTNATGGPIFGVHIVPRKLGMVKVEDQLEVIE